MSELATSIQTEILLIRGRRVILDEQLARLYGVETRVLIQQVRRNIARFPDDFMLQLSADEVGNLRSQFVISSSGHGGRRSLPYAFTEQGVAMLSSVLRSEQAVAVNIEIMRAFVELRRRTADTEDLKKRIDELEARALDGLDRHEAQLAEIFKALRALASLPPKRKHPVGFRLPEE